MKIAILGTPDTILGFKAVGVEPYGVKNDDEAREAISHFKKSDDYAIVLVTEDLADRIDSDLSALEEGVMPAVIRIPSSSGATGAGLQSLKKIVERAVGSDILK